MKKENKTGEERHYRALIENMKDGAVLLGADNSIIYCNRAFAGMLKLPVRKVIGAGIEHFVSPADLPEFQKFLIESRTEQCKCIEREIAFLAGEGTSVPLYLTASTEEVHTTYLVALDLTESRKAEQEHRKEHNELEQCVKENTEKLAKARSEFLTIMSHEMRTPMTSVIGYSIILKEMSHGKLNEKQEFYVDNILISSKHLLELINDVLDMAKMESGKLELFIERIPVPDVINEILNIMKERARKKNIKLKSSIDPNIKFIEADGQRFRQILFNLLSNALKFCKEDGGIIDVSVKKESASVKISVSDNGIGIRKEDMPRLFQKFTQIDTGISRKYEGTGLGLAISKQLIELHGGKINVESKFGEGSTFTFSLPLKNINISSGGTYPVK